MLVHWIAAGIFEAKRRFRQIGGYRGLRTPFSAIERHAAGKNVARIREERRVSFPPKEAPLIEDQQRARLPPGERVSLNGGCFAESRPILGTKVAAPRREDHA